MYELYRKILLQFLFNISESSCGFRGKNVIVQLMKLFEKISKYVIFKKNYTYRFLLSE